MPSHLDRVRQNNCPKHRWVIILPRHGMEYKEILKEIENLNCECLDCKKVMPYSKVMATQNEPELPGQKHLAEASEE